MLWLLSLTVLNSCGGSGTWDAHLPDYEYIEYDELTFGEMVGLSIADDASVALVDRAREHIPKNKLLNVSGSDMGQCGGLPYKYQALNDDLGLHLRLRMRLKFEADLAASRKSTILSELAICEQRSRETWQKAGLDVQVEFVDSGTDADVEISVFDRKDRSDSRTYYVGGNGSKISSFYCGTYTHEVGHLLGLPDEYSESGTCRSEHYAGRDEDFPHSLMQRHGDVKRTRFALRHVRQVLDQIHRSAAGHSGPVMVVGKIKQNFQDLEYGSFKVPSADQSIRECDLNWSTHEKVKLGELGVQANVNWMSFKGVEKVDDVSKASEQVQRLTVTTTNSSGLKFFVMDCQKDSSLNVSSYRKLLDRSGLTLKKVPSPLGEAYGWEQPLWESRGPSDPDWLGHLIKWGS